MNGRVPERIHVDRNHHLDSTRWDGFVPRDDDIVVTTAYKAGTTWTLRILAAFVFGPGPLRVPVREFAPWIDARIAGPIEPVLERVEAQRHRRFLKSHRDLPNVLFVHYGDLKADPETEIRRIAAFCGFDIDEDAWPALLETVGLDAMRAEARGVDDPMTMMWTGGADRCFYRGTNGGWRDVLTDDDLARYERAAATLDPDLRGWMERDREVRHAAL